MQAALSAWGIGSEATAWLFIYMLVFNSGAEELFWRGFVHRRFTHWEDRTKALLLITSAFASYHLFTVYVLTGDLLVSIVALGGVFIGGLTWAWLRETYHSVYPALLGHLGATAGYMGVYALYLA